MPEKMSLCWPAIFTPKVQSQKKRKIWFWRMINPGTKFHLFWRVLKGKDGSALRSWLTPWTWMAWNLWTDWQITLNKIWFSVVRFLYPFKPSRCFKASFYIPKNTFKPSRCIKASFYIPKNRLNFPTGLPIHGNFLYFLNQIQSS